ncbi:MAG: Hsp33 family molecular chaperone HslO [Limnochordaceae bacterium]|nr:Hsp33 family molecular chaperone HslO [Limnochordaceae bacterium]
MGMVEAVRSLDDPLSRDRLVHAMTPAGDWLALAARTDKLVAEARRRHDTWPTATCALGRALTGALLLAGLQKGQERVLLELMGNGPLGMVVAEATGTGAVRGYVQQPHVELPRRPDGKIDVGAAVGKGTLWVIKELGLREPYRGAVPLVSGEIAQDLAHYLASSEQRRAAVALGVSLDEEGNVLRAGGLLVEALPGATDASIRAMEARLQAMPTITHQLEEGKKPEELLQSLFADMNLQILSSQPAAFTCSCSRQRLGAGLLSLGEEAIREMIAKDHGAQLVCRFCGRTYEFSEGELRQLLAKLGDAG